MIVLGSFPSLIELGFVSSTNSFLALSIGNALGLVGRIFWGLTADRLNSSEKTLAIIGLTTCILIALLLIDSSTAPFVFLLTGFVAVGWNGVFHAAIRIKLNDSTSAATATVMAYLFASGLVGQIIFSTFLDHLGPIAALLASLLFVSIGTLFAFALLDLDKKPIYEVYSTVNRHFCLVFCPGAPPPKAWGHPPVGRRGGPELSGDAPKMFGALCAP